MRSEDAGEHSAYCVPGPVLSVLCTLSSLILPVTPKILHYPILQTGQPRHSVVKLLA